MKLKFYVLIQSTLLICICVAADLPKPTKPSAAQAKTIAQQAATKNCSGVTWNNLDLTDIVFLPETDFSNAQINNCKFFTYKKPTVTTITKPNPAPISPDCIRHLPPPFTPLLFPPKPLPAKCKQRAKTITITVTTKPQNASFAGANFNGATITNCSFDSADLTGASCSNATFTNTSFKDANLTSADFSQVKNLQGADFTHAVLIQAKFQGNPNISGIHFTEADLTQADFSNVLNLQQTSFANCHMNQTNFQHANLSGAHFTGSDLTTIQNFTTVTSLDNTVLDFALCQGLTFPTCSAKHLSAKYAHLEGITINGPSSLLDYSAANFTGAYLVGAQISNISAPASSFTTAFVGSSTPSATATVTTFENCNLSGCSSLAELRPPQDSSGNPLPNQGGLILNNCNFNNGIARGITIGNLQFTNATQANGAAFTDIKATNLQTMPWMFTSSTSLYSAIFSGDPDATTPTDLGTTTFDVDTDITGTRFENLTLCSVCFTSNQAEFAQAADKPAQGGTPAYQPLLQYVQNLTNCQTPPCQAALPGGL